MQQRAQYTNMGKTNAHILVTWRRKVTFGWSKSYAKAAASAIRSSAKFTYGRIHGCRCFAGTWGKGILPAAYFAYRVMTEVQPNAF